MSKGFKITLAAIFTPIVFIVVLIGLVSLAFSDPIDYFVAKTVPIYPQSQNVKVSASNGFPDGAPGSTIEFYTNSTQDQLLNFYSSKLKSQSWEEKVKYYNEGEYGIETGNNTVLEGTKTMSASYTKKILNMPFKITFNKTDILDIQRYRDHWKRVYKASDSEIENAIKEHQRVLIFVYRETR